MSQLNGGVKRLTSTNKIDDCAPKVAGSVSGEHYEHWHEEGCVPQVYAADHKTPRPANMAAGRHCVHAKDAFAPAHHSNVCPLLA